MRWNKKHSVALFSVKWMCAQGNSNFSPLCLCGNDYESTTSIDFGVMNISSHTGNASARWGSTTVCPSALLKNHNLTTWCSYLLLDSFLSLKKKSNFLIKVKSLIWSDTHQTPPLSSPAVTICVVSQMCFCLCCSKRSPKYLLSFLNC